MTGPKGNSEFCFPKTLNVPRSEAEGNINEITYYLVSSNWIYLHPFICHFQFPASNYWYINTAIATTTVSFICMTIIIQHCKGVEHTVFGRPTAKILGQTEKSASLFAPCQSTGSIYTITVVRLRRLALRMKPVDESIDFQ